MITRFDARIRSSLGKCLLLGCAAIVAGCGLFETLPQFSGSGDAITFNTPGDIGVDAGSDGDPDVDIAPKLDSSNGCGGPEDCRSISHTNIACTDRTCIYTCEPGFGSYDRDPAENGCQCAITKEVCDGQDNDCDGFADNLFSDGQIAVGGAHTCATDMTGQIYCWGANSHGQLGIGISDSRAQPTRLPVSADFWADQLSAGERHTCALGSTDASVWCWGANTSGQLGDTTTDDRIEPVRVDLLEAALVVEAGKAHTCVLDAGYHLQCWGDNSAGQLGVSGEEMTVSAPTPIHADLSFKAVAAGSKHTCALTQNGQVYCWGDNVHGQLGVGDFDPHPDRTQPTELPTSGGFSAIAAGGASTCALHADGDVYCWGSETAIPQTLSDANATALDFSDNRISVGAGGRFCALNPGVGALSCGVFGEESVATHSQSYHFRAIAVGSAHNCGINQNGRAYCWGDNADGQIGNGTSGGSAPAPLAASCK